jgi:uncharacterized protein
MHYLDDASWVISASDLTAFAQCPWRLARVIDAKLGKLDRVPVLADPMMELVAELGLVHEQRTLQELKLALGIVVEIPYEQAPYDAPAALWRGAIQASCDATVVALHSPADALFQATFYQPQLTGTQLSVGFQGFADFIVRDGTTWEIWDTKLARRAKEPALIQLAAYADQLHQLGISTSPTVRLILGDGTASVHVIEDLLPAFQAIRDDVLELIEDRCLDPEPLAWGSPTYPACGGSGCAECQQAILAHDDLFQIAGLRKSQRTTLRIAGYMTLAHFGDSSIDEVRAAVRGIGRETLLALHRQARLQVATRESNPPTVAWEVLSPSTLNNIPTPDRGDLFFDFEGDPTYQEWDSNGNPVTDAGENAPVRFGVEYLFGIWGEGVNPGADNPDFLSLWADGFGDEKAVLEQFCTLVSARREAYPDMRVYHYAAYERTKLRLLRTRHDTAHACVELLLSELLVDLYPIVTKGVALGLPRYGLKTLEPLYLPEGTRTGIAGGGESVVAFHHYRQLRDASDEAGARELKNSILRYNEVDCYSTKLLRDWLLTLVKS